MKYSILTSTTLFTGSLAAYNGLYGRGFHTSDLGSLNARQAHDLTNIVARNYNDADIMYQILSRDWEEELFARAVSKQLARRELLRRSKTGDLIFKLEQGIAEVRKLLKKTPPPSDIKKQIEYHWKPITTKLEELTRGVSGAMRSSNHKEQLRELKEEIGKLEPNVKKVVG